VTGAESYYKGALQAAVPCSEMIVKTGRS